MKSNTTLVFMSGSHRLHSKMSVTHITNLSMLSNSTLEEYQSNITCYQNAGFKFDSIDYLLIRRLAFVGCGNNTALSVELFKIEMSIFQGQNHSRTALVTSKTNVTILNSSFTSNMVGSCLTIFAEIKGIHSYSCWWSNFCNPEQH